jgi:hypothetical protein
VSAHDGALEAIEEILNRSGDADDMLRQVVWGTGGEARTH